MHTLIIAYVYFKDVREKAKEYFILGAKESAPKKCCQIKGRGGGRDGGEDSKGDR